MKLILLENHRLPIVVARALISDVTLREPAEKAGVAALMGDLLEEGTTTRSGEAIATAIENTGGAISLNAAGGSLKVMTPDWDLGLTLFFDCLINPVFPKEAIERKRDQLLSVIADVETQPNNRARNLFNSLVYGQHPFGRSAYGKKEIVEKLTFQDLKQFHRVAVVPNATTVVIVGDFDSEKVRTRITELTKAWEKSEQPLPKLAAPPVPSGPHEEIITDLTASQTHVYLGHLGIKRNDPNYHTLLVLDNVLGTGSGFTDRLSATLRDRQGLAYTVNAQITASASDQQGTFRGYIGTFPEKYLIAKEGFLNEIGKIRDEPATVTEVADAQQFLLGNLPFKLTTADRVASELLAIEKYQLGLDYVEQFKLKVSQVTPAMIHEAAKKYLDPNRLVIVAVGPIGTDGKPLPAPKKR
jgi:zinc protease